MLRNYFTIALRNIFRHKVYSAINISGFSVGIAASILILVFVWTTLSVDTFHKNASDIYLLHKIRTTPTGEQRVLDTWVPMLAELKKDYPGIRAGVRIFDWDVWVKRGSMKFEEEVTYADPSVFSVFDFPLLRGNPTDAFSEKNSLVLSQAMATKYFGNEDPVGKTLNLGFQTDFKVTGVLADIPQNSSIQFDILANFEGATHIPFVKQTMDSWGTSYLSTYLLLDKNQKPEDLQNQFPGFVSKHWSASETKRMRLELMPLTEISNELDHADTYAYILLAIALSILTIACVNFMNLTTARSIYRAKEIGMRKVLGADRWRLITQFLSESVVVTLLALLIGILLAWLLLPIFNEFVDKQLTLDPAAHPQYFIGLLGLALFIGLFAGSYPAFFLSRFKPVETLKKEVRASSSKLRFGLVVLQFCLSAILIIATGIIFQQTTFMKHQNLNFDRDNIIVINSSPSDFEDPREALSNLQTFKNEMRNTTGVLSVTTSSSIPGNYMNSNMMVRPENWGDKDPLRMRFAVIDEHYLPTFGLQLAEGRNFSGEISSDMRNAVIINKTALKAIGWESAVGKSIMRGDNPVPIIGVMQDFNFQSLSNPILPVVHFMVGEENPRNRFISVKVEGQRVQTTLQLLEAKWHEIEPTRDFDYFFVDQNFDRLYRSEENLIKIVGYCTALAVIIACLGLLGLASFTVVQRTREIGIRKVLGASTVGIVTLFVRQFTWPIVVANLLAWPIAYFMMNNWLDEYAYKMDIGIGIFILTTGCILAMAAITVSLQSLRAALENPAETLQYE